VRAPLGELLASLFNYCLVYEHHWDIIAYGINAFALGAFQPAAVRLQFNLHLADWAGKYLEKSLDEFAQRRRLAAASNGSRA